MSQLSVTVLQLGLLVVLWVFVLLVVSVLRRDLYGTRVLARVGGRGRSAPAPAPPAPAGERGAPAPRPAPDVPRRLVVTEGPLRGTTIELGRSAVLIGRAPECSLVLDDDYASSRHARLSPALSTPGQPGEPGAPAAPSGGWRIEDLGSTNGTLLSPTGRGRGEALHGAAPVAAGAVVRIGRTTLELQR